jgi:hypothetical protein
MVEVHMQQRIRILNGHLRLCFERWGLEELNGAIQAAMMNLTVFASPIESRWLCEVPGCQTSGWIKLREYEDELYECVTGVHAIRREGWFVTMQYQSFYRSQVRDNSIASLERHLEIYHRGSPVILKLEGVSNREWWEKARI